MKIAEARRPDPRWERLLIVDPGGPGGFREDVVGNLGRFLEPGDVVVVNDAAALPASLPVRLIRGNDTGARDRAGGTEELELRLAGSAGEGDDWWGVLFGEGSWRTPTEDRPPAPPVLAGDILRVAEDVTARVVGVSPLSPRLLRLRFNHRNEALYGDLYRHGRPVQYSYLRRDLSLWDVQTPYGARPWAVEMPSAGRPLTWDLFLALQRSGIRVTRLTHAAGLSSTGDPELDRSLPLPERYEIPEETVRAVEKARREGRRILAVGTTTVRALEGNAASNHGVLTAGPSTTDLLLDPSYPPRVVDGLFTGVHEPGTSHFALMQAFAPGTLLDRALHHAEKQGFVQHEFGDSVLVLPGSLHVPKAGRAHPSSAAINAA